jgi:hypothetical protein
MASENTSTMNVVSSHGTEMLQIFLNNPECKVLMAHEFIQDDGYDKNGPKYTSYDLFIISQNLVTNKYDYYHFQTEYMFNKDYTNVYYTSNSDKNSHCVVHESKYLILPNLELLSYKLFSEIMNICQHTGKGDNEVYVTRLNYSELTSLKITCDGVLFTPSNIGIRQKLL